MPPPLVYFDSAVFIHLLSGSGHARDQIGLLLKELKQDKARIYTSVITVQETSVLSFRQGRSGRDTTEAVGSFARIVGVDRRVALAAAKLEADIADLGKLPPNEHLPARRKWDCFHLATATVLGCAILYTGDKRFQNTAKRLKLGALRVLEPTPTSGSLFSQSGKVLSMPGGGS